VTTQNGKPSPPLQPIDLPIVIDGRAIWPTEGRDTFTLAYDSGVRLLMPRPTEEELAAMRGANKYILHDLNIQEIISFLSRVGAFWGLDNLAHPLYLRAVNLLCAINGYSRKMAQREMNITSAVLSLPGAWHDLLDAELGSRFYLEDWLHRHDALIHAQPIGNILHVLVGNVPVSGVMSIVRGCITKNRTIAKLAKRDPVTTLFFILSCLEIDPNHPVSRSLTAMYWPAGDDLEQQIIDQADVVCAWGGAEAMRQIKAKARPGVDVLEFGPKTSVALIGAESADSARVALDLAHDVSLYDQEACFSPQIVFVEGDHQAFANHLRDGLYKYSTLLAKGQTVPDVHAHVWRSRLEAHYNQNDMLCSPDTEWTIITVRTMDEINEHPLSRCIYVFPIATLQDCLPHITPNTQTIAMSPWNRNPEIRDAATLRGATKITEVGLVEAFRVGTTHDGIFPLSRLVRWACIEKGADYWGKYIQQGPLDTTRWLMMNAAQLESVPSEAPTEDGRERDGG
jgi:long-chain-fatty-acyl-CoA reductase